MSTQRTGNQRAATVMGLLLIGVGALLLLGQGLRIDLGVPWWPIAIVVGGVAIIGLAFAAGQEAGPGVAGFGGLVAVAGLVLLYQASTGRYESWAYAWALVAPGGVGLGFLVHGALTGNGRVQATAWPLIGAGVVIFLLGALFFEGMIGLGGLPAGVIGDWVLPALLVGVGALFVARSLFTRR